MEKSGRPSVENGLTRFGKWVKPRDMEGRPDFQPIKTMFPESVDRLTLCLVTACQSARESPADLVRTDGSDDFARAV